MDNYETSKLLKLKAKHDNLYYNIGKPIITDNEYDKIIDELKSRDIISVSIGAPINKVENKVKLPFYLGSLDKIKTEKELLKWKEKNVISSQINEYYILMPKLDGVSALLCYDMYNIKLYTRGDGKHGSDISYLIPYINTGKMLENLKSPISIRGELIISKRIFNEKYKYDYSNARNMVTGLIDTKTNNECFKDICFISYEIIQENVLNPEKHLNRLESYGNSIEYKITKILTMDILYDQLNIWKNKYDFEIDGLVLQPNVSYKRNIRGNPKYQVAFKTTEKDNIASVVVDSVEWNVSMHSVLKPRVKINPTKLDGIIITYATGFNAKFIKTNNIGPGTELKITRSGNVIPYILEVTRSTYAQMPEIEYIWNDTNVDITIQENNDSLIKKINHFFVILKVKYVSLATITKLYDNGYNTLIKIISAKESDFLKIQGIQEKSANRIYTNIHNSLKQVKLYKLMAASMIFGFGISIKKLKILVENIPDILEKPITINDLNNLEGFSDITSEKILNGIEDFKRFYKEIKPYIFMVENDCKKTFLCEKPRVYVFSGFRDYVLEETLINKGHSITTSVSKNTTAVIINNEKPTAKTIKAKELNIPIILRKNFSP